LGHIPDCPLALALKTRDEQDRANNAEQGRRDLEAAESAQEDEDTHANPSPHKLFHEFRLSKIGGHKRSYFESNPIATGRLCAIAQTLLSVRMHIIDIIRRGRGGREIRRPLATGMDCVHLPRLKKKHYSLLFKVLQTKRPHCRVRKERK
jgi:hypothetical protein